MRDPWRDLACMHHVQGLAIWTPPLAKLPREDAVQVFKDSEPQQTELNRLQRGSRRCRTRLAQPPAVPSWLRRRDALL